MAPGDSSPEITVTTRRYSPPADHIQRLVVVEEGDWLSQPDRDVVTLDQPLQALDHLRQLDQALRALPGRRRLLAQPRPRRRRVRAGGPREVGLGEAQPCEVGRLSSVRLLCGQRLDVLDEDL